MVVENMTYAEWSGWKEKAKKVADSEKSAIIRTERPSEVSGVKKICDLDIEKYRCITPDITTREVIITDKQVQHIKERHPGHFEEIGAFLESAIKSPDYILADAQNTGLILKQAEGAGTRLQLVLRLHTSADPKNFKNSIISAWKISESRWRNYINNRKVLYKSE